MFGQPPKKSAKAKRLLHSLLAVAGFSDGKIKLILPSQTLAFSDIL